MKDKVRPWLARIQAHKLKKDDMAYALNATIMKQIEYMLPATSFTKQQCDALMREILQTVLPKAGFVKSYPRDVLYAPYDQLGLQIQHPYTTQLTAQLHVLTNHGNNDSITGKLLRNNLQALAVELGLPGNTLQYSFAKWGHLATDSWIVRLWQMVQEQPDISLHYKCPQVQLARENDQFLMEAFAKAKYSKANLLRLNRCRIYLQAMTVADLATGDGKRILPGILKGQKLPLTWNTYDWPEQGPLPTSDWELWARAISRLFVARDSINLKNRLGAWRSNADNWPTHYDADNHQLWMRQDHGWRVFQRKGCLSHTFYSFEEMPEAFLIQPPASSHKTKAWMEDGVIQFTGWHQDKVPTAPVFHTFEQFIQHLSQDDKWVFEYLSGWEHAKDIAEGIRQGQVIAVADGSFKFQSGTAGFILYNLRAKQAMLAAHRTPGMPSTQCAYRSELGGILGATKLSRLLSTYFGITSGHLTVACDNQGAGHRSILYARQPGRATKQADMIRAILEEKRSSPVQYLYRYVEGHQRERRPLCNLDIWAELNEEMDGLAKAFWSHHQGQRSNQQLLYDNEWAISINNEKISHFLHHQVSSYLHTKRLHKWYQKKKHWTPRQLACTNFKAIRRANKTGTSADRKWRSKFDSKMCPVGRQMFRWKLWKYNRCPRCFCENETTYHVLRCRAPGAVSRRSELWEQFLSTLSSIHTSPDIYNIISSTLNQWLNYANPIPSTNPQLHQAIRQQNLIGWEKMWNGRTAIGWELYQDQYLEQQSIRYLTAEQWSAALVTALWKFVREMWYHRNQTLHDPDNPEIEAELMDLDLKISEQWHMGSSDLHPMDQVQFSRGLSLDELLAKPTDYRRSWLYYALAAREAAVS